jgi:hypothetical protein
MTNMSFKLQFLAIGISIAAMAIVPSIVNSALAQPQSGGAANSITISSSGKNYKCAPVLHKHPHVGYSWHSQRSMAYYWLRIW